MGGVAGTKPAASKRPIVPWTDHTRPGLTSWGATLSEAMPEPIGSATAVGRERAAALLALRREKPPVDVAGIIESFRIRVVERVLGEETRGTIGDIAGQRAIILNRRWTLASS